MFEICSTSRRLQKLAWKAEIEAKEWQVQMVEIVLSLIFVFLGRNKEDYLNSNNINCCKDLGKIPANYSLDGLEVVLRLDWGLDNIFFLKNTACKEHDFQVN